MNAKYVFLFLAAALPSLFAYTQTMNNAPAASHSAPISATAMSPQTQNGVTYACGGVGVDDAQKMKLAAPDYDLMLTFAARDAGYLADVNVKITDEAGKPVLQTFCGGPMLLVEFPHAGQYDIHAETGGYTLERKVSIKKQPETTASVTMLWPQQFAEAVTPASTSAGSSGTAGTSGSGGNEEEGGAAAPAWTPAIHGGE